MGIIQTDLKITNILNNTAVTVKVMVDTGSTYMCLPRDIARQLGFDTDEMPCKLARVADGRLVKVPFITPLRLDFGNRDCTAEALIMGDEPLMGVLALEAMDLIVDPLRQRVEVNPLHPDCAVYRV